MNLPVSPSPAPSAPAGSLGRSARAVFSGSTSRSGRQCESGCPRRPRRRSPAGCRSVFFTLSESETKEGVGGAHSLRLGDSPFILNSQRQRAGGWSCRARAGPPTSRRAGGAAWSPVPLASASVRRARDEEPRGLLFVYLGRGLTWLSFCPDPRPRLPRAAGGRWPLAPSSAAARRQ